MHAYSLFQNSNKDDNHGPEKSHFWFNLYFLCGLLGFCFFALNFVNRKTIKCFSMKLNKYIPRKFPRSPDNSKKVFSRRNIKPASH